MSFPQASDYRPPIIPDGEIYDNPENGKSYYWTQILLPEGSTPDTATSIGGYWTVVCEAGDSLFVLKAGDTMTGELELNNAQRLYLNSTKLETRVRKESLKDGNGDPVLDGNGNEQWDNNEKRFIDIESLPPHLLKSDGTFSSDTSQPFGINIEIDDGNTFKNQVKVSTRNGDIVTVAGGTGPVVNLGKAFPGNQDPANGAAHWEAGEAGGVKVTGIPTPTKENPDSSLAANKGYVDQREAFLQNEIIELEEEIDAIAPSIERGKWVFTAVGTVANPGQFTMYDADFGNGQPTGLFKSAKSIWFNEIDSDGTPHAFADVDDGELLEIFVEDSSEYGLYEIVGEAHDETLTGTKFWVIDVNFVRTLEATTAIGPGEVCRFKIFMAPTGGDASSFVMKTGDEMSGKLTLSDSTALNLKGKIQVNGTTTNSRFLGTDSFGNTVWKTAVTSSVQSDWNTTSTSSASYIKNKPTIPSAPTYTITKSGGNYYVS